MTTHPRRTLPRLHPVGLAAWLLLAGPAAALPQGATVVSGRVTVATPSPTLQVVTQTSARGIVDWTSFSLAAGERVRFDQPSSSAVLLNRVTGSDPSRLFGQVQSNGQIFLLNPNGVVFGSSARIDVGSLVASTLTLSDADFLAGRYALREGATPAGALVNEGTIRSAPGGAVVLAAPQLTQAGTIEAPQGRVALAAAGQVLVDLEGDGRVLFRVDGARAGNRLDQLGTIRADGGSVELRAAARGALADTVLNMSGLVQARGLGVRDGRVVIDGGAEGLASVAGTVDVSGAARGGQVEVTGAAVHLAGGAHLDARGAEAGGTVLVGGGWQGSGAQRRSTSTNVEAGAQIDVSATRQGDGGTAVVWSDGATRFRGQINALGGAGGGNGGAVEVSGKRWLDYAGTVDTRASAGRTGSLLLDPAAIEIVSAASPNDTSSSGTNPVIVTGDNDTSKLPVTILTGLLTTNNVTVDATGGTGNAATSSIDVQTAVTWTTGRTLTLNAGGGGIKVGANITGGTGAGLNLYTDGAVTGGGDITLPGGALRVAASDGAANSRAGSFALTGTIDTRRNGSTSGNVAIATDGTLSAAAIRTNGTGGGTDGTITLDSNGDLTLGGALDAGNATVTLRFGQGGGASTLRWDTGASLASGTGNTATATGGTGRNTLEVNSNAGTVTLTAGTLTVGSNHALTVSSVEAATLAGGAGNNQINASTWGGDLRLQVSRGDDTLTGNGARTTLAGTDDDGTWTLSAANRGRLDIGADTTQFSGVAQIAGGLGNNTFAFTSNAGNSGSLTGGITGAAGATANTLDLSGLGGTLTVDLSTGVASGAARITGFSGLSAVVGNQGSGSTTLAGSDSATTYTLAGAGSGTAGTLAFSGITSIAAGSGADRFEGTGGRLAGTLSDGGGASTLTGTLETGGDQTYTGAVTLAGNTTLRSTGTGANVGNIQLGAGVNGSSAGAQDLSIVTNGDITFGGSVGATTALGALAARAGTQLSRAGAINASSTSLSLQDSTGTDQPLGTGIAAFFAGGPASSVQVDAAGDLQNLTIRGASVLPALTVSGTLSVTAADTLTQTGALQVGGTTSVFAGAHAIQLDGPGNGFQGAVSLSNSGANDVRLANGNATVLGTLRVGSGALAVDSTGAITQAAGTNVDIRQTGAGGVSFEAHGNDITLTKTTNQFAGPVALAGAAVKLHNNQALTLDTTSASSLEATAGGRLDQAGVLTVSGTSSFSADSGSIDLGGANQLGGAVTLASTGASVALSNTLDLRVAGATLGTGTLTLQSGGALAQDGAITQAAGAGAVSLGATTVTLDHAGNRFTGPVSVTSAGDVTLHSQGTLALGTLGLGAGALSLTGDGGLTQSGAITQAAGAASATLDGGSGDVLLANAGNDFTVAVALSGRSLTLADANDLAVASLNRATNGSLSLRAGASLTLPSTTIDTGTGDLTLGYGTLAVPLGRLAGRDVQVDSGTALAIGDVVASRRLTLSAADAPITQQTGTSLSAGGAASIDAGTGDLTLANGGNLFGAGVALTGGAVTVVAQTGLNVTALSSGANQQVSLQAGGTLATPAGGFDTGTAVLRLVSGAALQTQGALSGGDVHLEGATGLALGGSVTARSTLELVTSNAAITQSAGTLAVTGGTTVNAGTGSVGLARDGNSFGGSVSVDGGAVDLHATGALTLARLEQAADQPLTLVTTGLLTLSRASLDTGSADLTLSAGSLAAGTGTLHGRNLSVTSGGAVTLGNIQADGTLALSTTDATLTQQAGTTIVARGAATITTGRGDATLDNDGNQFGDTVGGRTGSLRLRAAGDIALADLAVGGALALTSTTGTITQRGNALGVTGTTTLDAGGRAITLRGNANDFGDALALTGGTVDITTRGALQLGAVQAAQLRLRSGDALTQSGAVHVDGRLDIDTAGHDITLTTAGNRFGSVALAGATARIGVDGDLSVASADLQGLDAQAGGAITQSGALVVRGDARLVAGGDITLTHADNDFARLALAGGAVGIVDRNDLAVTVLNAGANRAVSLQAGGTLTLPQAGATIDTGSADLTLASLGGLLTSRGNLAGAQVTLTGRDGIVLGGDVRSTATQTYATRVTLGADSTLDAGTGSIDLQAGLAGNQKALTVAGAARLGGDVTGTSAQTWGGRVTLGRDLRLDSGTGRVTLAAGASTGAFDLTVGSAATLGGSVSGSGAQTYLGRVTLADDLTLASSAGRIELRGGVDGGGHALGLSSGLAAADAIRTGDRLAGLARLSVAGDATLGGNVASSGDQRYAGRVALDGDATLDAGAGRIALDGALDGNGHRLALVSSHAAADAIRTGASLADLAALTLDGRATLGGSVTTGGAQRYGGALTLGTDLTLTGGSIRLDGTLDGAHALVLRTDDLRINAAVGAASALSRLDVQGGTNGQTVLGADVHTTGTQHWAHAITLAGDARLSAGGLNLEGAIDDVRAGTHALALDAGGGALRLGGAVGGARELASLDVAGPATLAGGRVATTGAQHYGGALTLAAAAQLSGATLAVDGAIDGAHALGLRFAQGSRVQGAIGAVDALASLEVQGALALPAGTITTRGTLTLGDALQLSGDAQLRAAELILNGPVRGAGDLLLQADRLQANQVSGTGVLRIAPRGVATSIGIAGGAGSLQIDQALINSASGFTRHQFGRNDGTGTVSVGNLALSADTVLASGSGALNLGGRVDGAFDLTLATGGTTRIDGTLGGQTALRSLTTDARGSAGEGTVLGRGASVTTSGNQTWADTLETEGAATLAGAAITATQAGNRFSATDELTLRADSVQLRSSTELKLGAVTLAQGGRIEADGVLHLDGHVQLGGGTLQLLSNATPDTIGFTDEELKQRGTLLYGSTLLREAQATIVQADDASIASAAGSLLVLRAGGGGSIQLLGRGNTLQGEVSAVSGASGGPEPGPATGGTLRIGFVRIDSSEIHVAGGRGTGTPDADRAGLEADALWLGTDRLSTGADGLIRARLPYLDRQGALTSLPALTLSLGELARTTGGGFGTPDGAIAVQVGSSQGGFITVRPKNAGGTSRAIVLLSGPDPRPFYDGAEKLTEIRLFYNGDAPRTPEETGALTAVTATVEDARQTRFEETVRTENVKSRLRSGVIAEVGSGRPATVGRESIRLPENCPVKSGTLSCQ